MYDNVKYKVYLYQDLASFDADIPVWLSSDSAITTSSPLDISIYATDVVYILVEIIQESGSSTTPILDSVTFTYTTG